MSNFCKPEKGKEVLFPSNGSIGFGFFFITYLVTYLFINRIFIRVYKICQLNQKKEGKNFFCQMAELNLVIEP